MLLSQTYSVLPSDRLLVVQRTLVDPVRNELDVG